MKAVRWEDTKRQVRELNPDWDAIRGYVEALGGTVDVVARVGDWTVKVA